MISSLKPTLAISLAAALMLLQGCQTTKRYEGHYKDISCSDLASYAALTSSHYSSSNMGGLGYAQGKDAYHDKKGAIDAINQSKDARQDSALRKVYSKKC